MLDRQNSLPTLLTSVDVTTRVQRQARLRKMLHLLMVLSLWLSTVSPLLVPAQTAQADTVNWGTSKVAPPPDVEARPPYRAGVEPKSLAASSAAPARAAAAEASVANTTAAETLTASDSATTLGNQFAPAWLAASAGKGEAVATTSDPALTPDWLEAAAHRTAAAGGFLQPQQMAETSYTAGICVTPRLAIAGVTPLSVVQGSVTTPYTFTTIISNTDYVTPTGALSLTLQVPANFYFIGNSASARSQMSGTLIVAQPLLNGAAGAPATVVVRANPAQHTLPVSDVITVTYRLAATAGGAPNPTLTSNLAFSGEPAACTLAQTVNTSLCPLAVRTPLQLQIPPYIVGRGNFAGDVYTVTVRNTGTTTATDVSFELDPSQGFFFKGNSATGESSQFGALTLQQPAGDTTPGSPFVLSVAGAFPGNTLAPGSTITAVLRLGTDANAKSGQPLSVTLRSGAVTPQICNSTRENIATGRGNLVIAKTPDVQQARLGDIVTWTVSLRNTGLASVYDAVLDDQMEEGLRLLSITPPSTTTAEIRPDQSTHYTVTAEVNSCTALRNNALASWSIGNIDGTGSITDPVSDDAFIAYLFDDAAVSVDIEPLRDLEFCGRPQRTVVVTVTSENAPARDLTLAVEENGSFILTPIGSDWVKAGDVLSYTANNGILRAGETVTFSLNISFTATVCDQNSGNLVLRPVYRAACPVGAPPEVGASAELQLQSETAPSLRVEKTASARTVRAGDTEYYIAAPGETVYYTVAVSGRNPISTAIGSIFITDTLPPIFEGATITRSDSGAAGVTSDDRDIETTVTPTSTPTYSASLFVSATVPVSGVCASGVPQINQARAQAASCPECLADASYLTLYTEDPAPHGAGGYFRLASEQDEVCGDVPTQQTAAISITNGITWAETIYRDGLNIGGGVGPLNVVSGSVQVLVDDVDRTGEVTVTTAPTLEVKLDNIGDFSQTAMITITYLVTSGDQAFPGDDIYYVQFVQGGYEDLQACGVTRYTPVPISIRRAAINDLRVGPPAINACSTNTVTLTVDGDHLDTEVTDQLVVTFTTDINDIITVTEPYLELSGILQNQPVTVTTATVDSRQVVSFTFDPALVITRPGTIAFPLYRPCGVETPLNADISYADACRVTKTDAASGGLVTRQSNLLLRVSPITYTIDTDKLDWQFAVRNAGDMTASNVLVTNTLPFGMRYVDALRSGVEPVYLDDIEVTTGTINPGTSDEREVVSFTVPVFPANATIQFAGNASVDTCNANDSLWIRLTQPCGGVGDTCGGSQVARLGIQEARGLLLTSNTQQATIPLCSAGDVRLIVKNASVKTGLYDFVIQQQLTDTTYVSGTAKVQLVRGDGTVSPFVPFTPTAINPANPAPPFQQTLEWDGAAMGDYPPEVRALLEERGPSDQLIIEFGVRTYCVAANPTVQASVQAANACSTVFRSSEDSQAVEVAKPIIELQKQVRNVSEEGDFAPTTFAASGDVLAWKIEVGNSSPADVLALHVTDTLPAWFTAIDFYTRETDYTPPIVQWKLYTGTGSSSPVPAEGSTTFWITGTVGNTACSEPQRNVVEASYGCSAGDICTTLTYTAEAEVDTDPALSIAVPDTTLDQCASGPLPVTFANTGARTGAVVVTYTLPSGYQFDGLAPGTEPTPSDTPTIGAKGVITFGYASIGQQQVTNTLLISVTRDMDAGACFTSAAVTATIGYADSCDSWQSASKQDSGRLTVLRSDLATFAQTPVSRTVAAGELYTWTITAPNTGDGATNNLVITETLDAGLEFVTATVGSSDSTLITPTYDTIGGRTVITWAVGSLPDGETWTAQVAAHPIVEQPSYRVTAEAHTGCDAGGCEQYTTASSYAAPLQFLAKQVSADKVSIAEPFVYTITADFFGSVLYTDTQLVDVLPRLDGRLAFSYTDITIANSNSAANHWSPEIGTPGVITFTTADGTVQGRDSLTITVSGMISNDVAAQQGVTFSNALTLSFFHDGVGYGYTDTVDAQVKEPILGLRKAATPTGNVNAATTLTYTLAVTHAAASDATAYNVVITDVVPPALTYNGGSLQVSAPAPGDVQTTILGNSLVITVSEYPTPAAPIYITYTAAPNAQLEPSSAYTNTAYVRYTSQPGDNPDDRNGSGGAPNDYWSSSSAVITTAAVSADKALLRNLDFTIGDLITYTVLVTLPTGTTRNLAITDSVPAGLLYVLPTSTVAVSATAPIALSYAITPSTGSGASPSQAILRMTAPVNNNTGAPAVITWTLQLLVVNDAARTANYNGAVKTNAINVTSLNAANQVQTVTDSAGPARVFEPLLHIGKEYVTAQACQARLLADNFNSGLSGWTITGGSGTWTAPAGWLRAPSAISTLLIHGADTWGDVSYSAIFSTTDTAGSVGLIFRAQNANNYYRFVWTRNSDGSGARQVVKVAAGSEEIALNENLGAGGGYTINRWYHLEIRSLGRQHQVYLDGQPVLTYTDNSANPFAAGSVGFYADNESGLAYDDALVTRLGDDGCLVDVNDLVTYTLTISNQERLVGHDLVITDVLPQRSLQYVTYTMASSDPAAVVVAEPAASSSETLVWRVNQLAPRLPFSPLDHSTLVLTVTARVLGDVSAGIRLPNQALLGYDGQAGGGAQGVERAYSGGSHSSGVRTPDAALIKTTAPATVTIGERLYYTLTLPSTDGLAATLYTATVTDVLPSGFRLVEPPAVTWEPAEALTPADIDTTRSTTKTALVDFSRVPSGTVVTVAMTAVVENAAANRNGVQYTNTATLGWYDLSGVAVKPLTSAPVTTTLVEPRLIIEKVVAPKGVGPGDTVFYRVRIYHAPTSTVPAYNVVISDVIPPEMRYISGSWQRDNEPVDIADTGVYTYTELGDRLEAWFPVISTTLTADNPLELNFQAVVDVNAGLGSLITNTVTNTWQSLPTDPDGERRDGSGGVNNYRGASSVSVSLDAFSLVKTGPLTATAGSPITYVVTLFNSSAITGQNAVLRDLMPFQVKPITATFVAPLRQGVCEPPAQHDGRPQVTCRLGDLPPYSSAVVTLTAIVDPATPDGSLIDNYAVGELFDSNGNLRVLEDEVETWIDTVADLSIRKTGPITAMAGDLITYTVVVSNAGPSHAHGVDVKDALPPGLAFVSGASTQGACVSAICQLGELEPGQPVTMVITATVGPNVSGTLTNTAYIFSSTADKNPSNNASSQTTVVGANTTLHVAKTDFTDPVGAGSTYLYQLAVTNTGPATAFGVLVTDTLPAAAIFAGASPGCTYAAGQVTCRAGDMLPGSWFGFLINVRVPLTITDGTVVTNHVAVTTTTDIRTASSVLTDSEPTTWVQAVNVPTDLAITKAAAPAAVVAGSGAPITYTLTVTNNGPAPAAAVQVADLFPRPFQLVSLGTSRPLTQAQCSSGGVCDLGALAVGQAVVVTLVMQAPADVAPGVYTNTAFVGSPASDTNPSNNTAGVPVTVTAQVALQARKEAAPNPAVVGESLSYVIFVTNTGPSDAHNVTVSDTLPAGFAPELIVSSQGNCAALPCNLRTLPSGANAWVHLYGTVASTVTEAAQLANSARVTAAEDPTGVSATVTPGLAARAALQLHKTQAAPAGAVTAGSRVTYTLAVTNTGPGLARSVDVKDQLPEGMSLATVAAAGGVCAGALCQFGNLPAGASRTMTVVAMVDTALAAGVVTNTAGAFSPDAPTVTRTVATTITTAANLHISKTALNSPVNAGEVLFYQIVVGNDGPSDAQSVVVTDLLPAGLAYAGGDLACAAAGNEIVCAIGVLPAGGTRTLLVQGRVDGALADGVLLTNVATATSPTAAEPVTNSVSTTVRQPQGTSADLSIVKNGPLTATAGGLITYTVLITNNGPAAAVAVNVLDALPADVSFAAAAPSQGLCDGGVTCALGDLPAGMTATVTITGLVNAAAVSGTLLVNTAQVGSSNRDSDPLNNTAGFTSTVHARARLTIDKRANAANLLVGEAVQYRIVVTNSGPGAAHNVVVSDALPAGLANPSVSSSQGGCSSFPCNLGSLAPGASATILVMGTASANGPLYNSAAVTSSTHLDAESVLASGVLVTVNPYADLALGKEAAPTAVAGGQVAYTLTVTNSGPSAAEFITLTDALPAQMTFTAAAPGCSESSGIVTCALDTLPAGSQAVFTITTAAAADIAPGSSLENRAAVTAATLDPAPANNTAAADTNIIATANLAISKRDLADPVMAGEFVTYTIIITNNGPSAAANVDVSDQWPAGMTLVAMAAGDGGECTGGLCRFGWLAAGLTRTVTATLRVDSATPPGQLVNRAAVYSPNSDQPTPTVVTETTTITTAAVLRISKTALNDPATAGGLQSYQITVRNDGPSDAQAVLVTDPLPAGTTYAGGDSACAADGDIVCQLGVLPAGASRSLLINVTVDADLPDGTTLTNVATATSPTAAPVSASVQTTVHQPQDGVADLAVSKLGTPQVTAGGLITYSLLVTNSGPSAAQNVQLVDALPLSVTVLAIAPSQGACAASVACALGDLPAGMTATVTITGLVNAAAVSGTLLVNTAQVGSSNGDSDPLNNTAGFTSTVDNRVRLHITKEATAETVAPGGSLTYRIIVRNAGPSMARDVVMTDLLPRELLNALLSSSRGSCSAAVCNLGNLPPDEIVTILVMGSVSPFASGSITNTATLTTSSPLDRDSVLSASAVTAIGDSADLVMAKSATPSVFAGQRITYVLSVYNAGPSTATQVQVVDQLPLSTTLAELDGACAVANGNQTTFHCPAAPTTLAAGETITFTAVVTADAALATGAVLQNNAEVSSGTADPNPVNNRATANTSISGRADLHVSKTADPVQVLAGERLTYTVIITNTGPSDANSVRLVDVLPTEVQQVGPVLAQRSSSGVPITCLNLVCELGVMPLDEVVTLTLPVRVYAAVADNTVFTNTATVYSPSDYHPANNVGEAAATARRQSTLAIRKSAAPDPAVTGAELVYTIRVQNLGPSDAAGVVVTDTLPAGFTLNTVSSSQGDCTALPCDLGALAAGASASIFLRGLVNPLQIQELVNTASVTATTPLTDTGRSRTTITTPVTTAADLQIILESTPTAIAGLTATVYANIVNHGPSSATGTVVTITLPPAATFNAAQLPPSWNVTPLPDGQVVLTTDTTLPPGAQIPLTLTVTLDPDPPFGSSIEFTGSVSAATPDPTPSNNTDTADTSIVAQAQIAIAKQAAAATVAAGGLVTYTIMITNAGPSTATSVNVQDQLPAGLRPAAVAAEGGVCAGPLCHFSRLPVNATRTMTVVAAVDAAQAAGVITNTAAVFSPDAPALTATVTTTVVTTAVLRISKAALNDPATAGGLQSYQITVRNDGPSDAQAVLVTDPLPTGTSYAGGDSACAADGDIVCQLGVLPAGASRSLLINVTVDADLPDGTTLTNVATATSPTAAPVAASVQSRVSRPQASADLALGKEADPTAVAGGQVAYTLTVTNSGPSAAEFITLTDALPAQMTFTAAAPGCSESSGIVTCALDTLPAGSQAVFTITAAAAADIAPGSSLENRAAVTAATLDPAPANNTAAADTSILALADFALAKRGPESVAAGSTITYAIAVTNNGPSHGRLQDIKDTLPPSLTLVSAALTRGDGSLTACAGAICQTAGPVAVGEVLTMTVVAQVDPALPPGTMITNTATVLADGATPDPDTRNNQDAQVTGVTALAQLALDKYDLIDPIYPDALLVYVLSVFNAGPSTAHDLLITDLLPGGVIYVSSTGDCTEQPAGVLTCRAGALPPGARTSFQVLVRVRPDVPNGAQLYNAATLTSSTPLTGSLLNADEVTLVKAPTGPLADLSVSKTANPLAVRDGDLVTFTLVVTNNGPAPVASAQLLDLLPAGLNLVSVQPSQGFCNAGVDCLLGELNYLTRTEQTPELRGVATITLVAQAENSLFQEQVLTNTAYVQSELQDPRPENNHAAAPVVLLPLGPRADVQIVKRDDSGVSTAGGLITYTLSVFNAGPSAAEDVVVEDPLPAGLSYIAAQPTPAGGLPAAPHWRLGTVQPNSLLTITLIARTDAGAQAGLLIHNRATVTTTTPDPVPANNASSTESQVFGTVDLEVRKTAQPTAPLAGRFVTYTIVLTNHGPSAAQDVDIKEALPPSVTLTSLTPGRGVCVSQICQFGVVSAGEQIVITAVVQVDPSLRPGTVLTNTVTGFTDTPDSNPDNNQDEEPILVGPLVNLRILKTTQAQTATVGTEITYTMLVTNYGPANSPNVVVTDNVPAGFAFLRTTNPGGCRHNDRWHVVCPLGMLPADQSRRFDIVFFIESVSPGTVTNNVVVNDPDAIDPEGGGQGEVEIPTDPKGPSAVTLTRFDVTPQEGGLLVTWETVQEIDSWSFRLWRSTVNERGTAELITPEPILARGSGSVYTWLDTQVAPHTVYYYWLQEIATSGAQKEIEVVQGGIDIDAGHKLYLPSIEVARQ